MLLYHWASPLNYQWTLKPIQLTWQDISSSSFFFTACWSASNRKVGAQESALQINWTAIFEKHWQCVKMPQSDILMPSKKDKSNILKKDKSNIYYGIVWAVGLACLLLGKIRQRVAIYRKYRCITPHRPSSSTERPLALFSALYSHKYFHRDSFALAATLFTVLPCRRDDNCE